MYLMEKEWIGPVSAGIEIFAAVICVVLLTGCLFGYHRKEKLRKCMIVLLILHIMNLLMDAVIWIMEYMGKEGLFTQVLCVCTYLITCVVFMLFSYGLVEYISALDEVSKWVNYAVTIYCIAAAVLWLWGVLTGNFFGKEGSFTYDLLYYGSQVAAIFMLCMDILLVFRHRSTQLKRDTNVMIGYAIFPLIGLLFQGVWSMVPLYIGCTVSMVIYYMMVYVGLSGRIKEQANILLQQENMLLQKKEELAHSREKILISQIQSHFIFNSIITIKYLCRHNQAEAEEAIDNFSGYLRGSMDALTMEKCVSLERELNLVNHYLYLEKKRFGDKIRVEFDVKESSFLVPPLAIQTLVENAVRHGIRKKLDGGCVKIKSWKEDTDYCVSVEDDGVGMDLKNLDISEGHVGLKNTAERLKLMCEGELKIESTPGEGTCVTVKIPVKK